MAFALFFYYMCNNFISPKEIRESNANTKPHIFINSYELWPDLCVRIPVCIGTAKRMEQMTMMEKDFTLYLDSRRKTYTYIIM